MPASGCPCPALLTAYVPRFPSRAFSLGPTLNPQPHEDERRNSNEINATLMGYGANLTGKADLEDFHYVVCWNSWWFFRTLFQSFGENSTTVGATREVLS